jgi:hypothetical protein
MKKRSILRLVGKSNERSQYIDTVPNCFPKRKRLAPSLGGISSFRDEI